MLLRCFRSIADEKFGDDHLNNINPAISVIVPMYNAEKYVGFCLDSIFNQVFDDYELILVDDASEDRTYEVCSEVCNGHPAVKIIKNQVNKGQYFCRNKGLEISRGKYVFFMDSDDEILPEALMMFYQKAEAENADVVHTNIYFISYSEGRMRFRQSLWEPEAGKSDRTGVMEDNIEDRLYVYMNNQPMPWLNLIRRDFLKENNITFRELRLHEDILFNLEVCLKAKKYVMIYEFLNIYRKYFNDRERVEKKLSQVLVIMNRAFEAFDDIFNQFTYEEIPADKRLFLVTGWLRGVLQVWIYDIVDTRQGDGYIRFRNALKNSPVQGEFIKYIIPLLISMIDSDSNIRIRMREHLEKTYTEYMKKFQGIEKGEHKGDYAFIYSLAKRATLLEEQRREDLFYEYSWLARAAFQLGRYREAWDAYEEVLKYVGENKKEKEKMLFEKNFIKPYLEAEKEVSINNNEAELPDVIADELLGSEVVFGVCAHFYSLTNEMFKCWQKIMKQMPGARLIIFANEFEAKPMMIEALERCLDAGFEPQQVRFEVFGESWYKSTDIMLDTYPVSGGDMIAVALSHGVPSVTLCGAGHKSRTGAKILREAGVEELIAKSRGEYIAKAVALAKDHELLHILKEKMPCLLR